MSKKVFSVSLALFFASVFSLAAFDVVTPRKQAVIVLPDKPQPASVLAAGELQEYVAKITGKKLQIVSEKDTVTAPAIRIGTLDTLKNLPDGAQKLLDKANAEASYIYVKGGNAFIVGKTQTAELYGVYRLLKEEFGVRWFKPATPEDSGEFVPKKTELTLADRSKVIAPWFWIRRLDASGVQWNVVPFDSMRWAARNGYQVQPPYGMAISRYPAKAQEFFLQRFGGRSIKGGHTSFSAAIPAAKYFKTNPEYFALIDGKRTTGQDKYKVSQYCLSNPDVRRLVAQYICNRIKANGIENGGYLFGMQDSSVGWCECDNCRKLDQSDKYNYLDISTRFHSVVKEIAKLVYAQYPDAQLHVWAYHTYRKIPRNVVHDRRMATQYCIHGRCYGHKLDDPECVRNKEQFALLKEWLKISSKVHTYEYFTPTPPLYTPHEFTQAHDLKLYKKLGITGWKEEASFYDSKTVKTDPQAVKQFKDTYPSCWQWLYVTGELLWNPDADTDKIIADAESLYYGKAYPAMKKYHDLRRKIWNNSRNCMGYPTGDQRTPFLLNYPDSQKLLLNYLAEAEKLANGDTLLAGRIADDKRYLETYWIKPNVEQKAKFGKEFRAPQVKGKLVIDGNGSDSAWVGACYTEDFKSVFDPAHPAIPEELKTRVGILSDRDNLYFLITAMEPDTGKIKAAATEKDGAVWADDSMEIFIYPPTAANTYYQLAVNTGGVIFDSVNPGAQKSFDLGATAKAKVLKDRYTVEIKVPVKKLGDFVRGEVWKLHFCRNWKAGGTAENYSIDGVKHHDYANYRALEIGSPYIKNGSFDSVKEGKVQNWSLNKNAAPVQKGEGSYSVALQKGGKLTQILNDRELWQKPYPRKIRITLRASGKGKLITEFYNYSDTPDRKAKHGYKRKFLPSRKAGEFELKSTPGIYQCDYTINANEWSTLVFRAEKGTAEIDDVAVVLQSVNTEK